MHRQNVLNTLDFQDDLILCDHIESIPAIRFDALILNRQRLLSLECDSSEMKFVAETFLVGGLEKSGTQRSMKPRWQRR